MKTRTDKKVEKAVIDLIDMTRDDARKYISLIAHGAEETSSVISFMIKDWTITAMFENDICKDSHAHRVLKDSYKIPCPICGQIGYCVHCDN